MNSFASIVVSAWNRLELLQRSLESLWENTYYPYELIVHDDGSQEETSKYLYDMMRAGKIGPLIQSPPGYNRGHGTSVNRAVDISEGKYIVKVNGDDKFNPGWLTKAVRAMELFPEIGLLHLAYYDYAALYNRRYPDDYWDPTVDRLTLHRETREGITIRVVWCGPGDGLIFTRETWRRVGSWDSKYCLAFGEDVTWRLRVCPMMRKPLDRTDKYIRLNLNELADHWEKYKDTPWLVLLDPPVIDFSWGEGLCSIYEAQKTLRHGPLLHGEVSK